MEVVIITVIEAADVVVAEVAAAAIIVKLTAPSLLAMAASPRSLHLFH